MDNLIRNFCIIAHIDHGKSTLADRLLEVTGTIEKRKMKEQLLDTMDIERERGITIKLQPARMIYQAQDGNQYMLNLIDTPGHVDFTYEVSRSLAAVEGAILLVDATQGIQAQTLANLYLALEQDLSIIPVVNKIDLPNAQVELTKHDIVKLLGCVESDILSVSGKTGAGVEELLESIVMKIPPPPPDRSEVFRGLIFDSVYDDYQGVIAYVRVLSGQISGNTPIHFIGTGAHSDALSVGFFKPERVKTGSLEAGMIGFVVTGLKSIAGCRVGDTIVVKKNAGDTSLAHPGYREVVPMVYAGLFCREGDDYPRLRDAMDRLKLNDAALQFETLSSPVLGFGFRCGFLGLLHLDIVQERIRREYGLELIVTTPTVSYRVGVRGDPNNIVMAHAPQELPDPSQIDYIEEPWVSVEIVASTEYIGKIMDLVITYRGEYVSTEYLDERRVILRYALPLASILVDFYDKLKGATSGYASMNYHVTGYRRAEVEKMDILIAEERVDSLSVMVYRDEAHERGKRIVEILKEEIPRQQFVIKVQAAIGGKIVAAERVPALRKDVTGYLYGGDVTRKRKLLEKQKKGKKRMMKQGTVELPTSAYLAVLKR